MKKFVAIFLALCLALSVAGCAGVTEAVSAAANAVGGTAAGGTAAEVIEADDTGYAYGYLGDTLRTAFFDFTVNSACLADSYEGYIPSEGDVLLVADVTVYNYTKVSVTMYDTDFQLQWDTGDGDEDYVYPITCERTDLYPNTGIEPMGDMLPAEYSLGIHESRTGLLVFEVPAATDYYIGYMEFYANGDTGDIFWVAFTPENRSSVSSGTVAAAGEENVITADGSGYAYGGLGDTLRTAFFDFTVNGAYLAEEYEGYAPSEGNVLLVVDMTVYNYTRYTVPMYDTDFQAQWGGPGDEDYAYPVTYGRTDLYPNTGIEPVGDMFPAEYTLASGESMQALAVFEVPEAAEYSVSYLEMYTGGETGDIFWVSFTPDGQTV